tara:strand:+ start:3573 stop:3776 length:204 start_codon:yes stop_codon:yes gene_type:complete
MITQQMKDSRKMQQALGRAKSCRTPIYIADSINEIWPQESTNKKKEIFYWVTAVALADFAQNRKYPF